MRRRDFIKVFVGSAARFAARGARAISSSYDRPAGNISGISSMNFEQFSATSEVLVHLAPG